MLALAPCHPPEYLYANVRTECRIERPLRDRFRTLARKIPRSWESSGTAWNPVRLANAARCTADKRIAAYAEGATWKNRFNRITARDCLINRRFHLAQKLRFPRRLSSGILPGRETVDFLYRPSVQNSAVKKSRAISTRILSRISLVILHAMRSTHTPAGTFRLPLARTDRGGSVVRAHARPTTGHSHPIQLA